MNNLLRILFLSFPFSTLSQKTLSHGLPFLNRVSGPKIVAPHKPFLLHAPTPSPSLILHQPQFLPLTRSLPGPAPLPKHVSPKALHPLLNAPLPSHHSHHHPEHYDDYDVPSNYQFTYHVADTYSGDVHHHSETKSEHKTEGQYSVKLPDGRTQVVTYTADDDGYHATVEYHGDIIHHPPAKTHPRPDHHILHDRPDHHILHGLIPAADPIVNEIDARIKYPPVKYPAAPSPPLLPKLFVPKKPVETSFKKPALKLEDPDVPGPISKGLAPIPPPTRIPKYRYSPTPTPYPSIETFHHEPIAHGPVVKPSFYKGKLVFINKP